MNIFGIGGMELGMILIIMLIVAGPKRMIQWAYVLGQYTTKLRGMWTETVGYLQKEFDEAGLDVQLPKEPPTRGNLNQTIMQAMKPLTKSLEEPLNEVNRVKSMATIDLGANGSTNGNGNGKVQTSNPPPAAGPTEPPPPPPSSPSGTFGTWSGAAPTSNPEDKPQ